MFDLQITVHHPEKTKQKLSRDWLVQLASLYNPGPPTCPGVTSPTVGSTLYIDH